MYFRVILVKILESSSCEVRFLKFYCHLEERRRAIQQRIVVAMVSGSNPPNPKNNLETALLKFMVQMEKKFRTMDLKIQQLSENQRTSTKGGDTEQDSHTSGKSNDDDLTAVKLKIPPFHSRNDPEEFLD